MRIVYALVLAAITGVLVIRAIDREPLFAFDGYAYGIRAQLDAGIPYDRALAHARAVYAPTFAMRRPQSRRWLFSPIPEWWNLFRVRVFYPWLCSLLWSRFDFGGMFIVSAVAYITATLLTYGFMLRLTHPLFAALVALAIALLPESRVFARADLTDMTSYAALVASLWAMSAFARSGRGRDLAVAVVCAVLLTITRPVPYVLACAALPLVVSPLYRRPGLILGAMGVALSGAVEIAFNFTHADVPSYGDMLGALWITARTAAEWVYTHPCVPIALGALIVKRREPEALVALGAWLSVVPTMILDPIPSDVERVVILPSFISLACGLAYAAQLLSRAYTATSAARLSAHPDRNTPPPDGRPWSQIQTSAS
jgi:hypothetical protein